MSEANARAANSLPLSLVLAAAVVGGAWIRLFHLDAQVLTGDELHAVKAALAWPLGQILSTWTYHGADYGVPLALLYRVALDAGTPISEWLLRAPVVAASVIAIAAMPWLLRMHLAGRARGIFAVAIALSPLLVLYGRLVRSYAPAVLFAFIAIVSFDAWQRRRSTEAAIAYGGSASLAIWLNLTSAPLVAAPVLFHVGRLVARRSFDFAEWRSAFFVGATALACVAIPLLPARESLLALGDIHGGGGTPSAETWLEVVRMHAGTRSPWLAALALGAVLRGGWIAYAGGGATRHWLALVAFSACAHVAGLLLLGPDQLENPIVINRYLLVLLPFGLSFAAMGLAAPLPRIPPVAQLTGVAALAAGIAATGPLLPNELGTTSFGNAPTYTYFVRDGNTVARARLPRFYAELAEAAAAERVEPIIEYPWFNLATHAFDAYQKHHRQPIVVAALAPDLHDSRLAFRNMLPARVPDYLAADARWLVVHLDLQNEERQIDTSDRNHWMRLETRPAIWEPLLAAGPSAARNLEARWGPPDFREDGLRVWDLERIRELSPTAR